MALHPCSIVNEVMWAVLSVRLILPFLVELGGEVVTDWIMLPNHGDCSDRVEARNEVQQ